MKIAEKSIKLECPNFCMKEEYECPMLRNTCEITGEWRDCDEGYFDENFLQKWKGAIESDCGICIADTDKIRRPKKCIKELGL